MTGQDGAPADGSGAPEAPGSRRPVVRLLQRVVEVREDEISALVLACAYFFFLLSAYFIMRPIREQLGVASGTTSLQYLYLGTLVSTLVLHPPFAALVARLPRERFITLSNRFFVANILAFYLAFTLAPPSSLVWIGRVFFVWISAFNLFVVSVFWAFMVDVFRTEQAKRLFGFIGVGGTLGAIAGSAATASLAVAIGPSSLLLVSAALLELTIHCVRRLSRLKHGESAAVAEAPIGGQTLAGVKHVLQSPYLLNMCLYMLLFTFGSTVLYFQQNEIVARSISGRGPQTQFFARIDLAVNLLTVLTQIFLTGRLIKILGITITLALLPILSLLGFGALGLVPALGVVVVFQVLRRAGEYAVARPTREVLYGVLSREDKYKAKHFIDTFIYRGGDLVASWSMAGMRGLGLGIAGTASVAAPLAAIWVGIAVWLGRRQAVMASEGRT